MSEVPENGDLTVYFDGACPLCTAEINYFKKATPPGSTTFEDVSLEGARRPEGVSREELLARFHVRRDDGTVLSGASAFVQMWQHAPGWRWLARMSKIPGALWIMEVMYRLFLLLRPILMTLFGPGLKRRANPKGSTE